MHSEERKFKAQWQPLLVFLPIETGLRPWDPNERQPSPRFVTGNPRSRHRTTALYQTLFENTLQVLKTY